MNSVVGFLVSEAVESMMSCKIHVSDITAVGSPDVLLTCSDFQNAETSVCLTTFEIFR